MRERIKRLADKLSRKGLRRGVTEGSNLWLALGAVGLLVRVLAQQDKPRKVTEELRVGQSIVVSHLPAPPTRRETRRAARAAGA
jgi:hypothetical protein